jgi:arylsulfatase
MTLLRKNRCAAILFLVSTVLTLAGQEPPSPSPGRHQQTSLAASGRKPNIVLMLMDNLGYGELGIYGGGILRGAPTPRIDKLASEGTRLLNFNVEAQCTPSRSALMTGRFPIRSGTYQVPRGGVPEGLTTWEITLPQLLSAQGYATGIWGKWHLGSAEARLPTNRGFDEWYGIPRTYSEVFWPELNDTHSLWPSVGSKQGWDPHLVPAEPIYEAHKGEKASQGRRVGFRASTDYGKGNHHARHRIHKKKREQPQTILRLCLVLALSYADTAESRICG